MYVINFDKDLMIITKKETEGNGKERRRNKEEIEKVISLFPECNFMWVNCFPHDFNFYRNFS